MIALSSEEVAAALGIDRPAAPVTGVSIDTRTLKPGDLYVALRGERHDGHDFVEAALGAGAVAAVVSEDAALDRRLDPALHGRLLTVPDTLQALGSLARAVRRKSGVMVVAVTGSAGKTSTKDLVAALAARARRVVATTANQNNEVGVPLTLLSVDRQTELVVVEMGMRGSGQIAALASVAEPDVGVITNVYPVHLELLGSLEAIAEAKAELLAALGEACVGVVPVGAEILEPYRRNAVCRVVSFGFGSGDEAADVWGCLEEGTGGGGPRLRVRWPEAEAEVDVPFVSRHRLENTMAAVAACYGAGLPVEECLRGLSDVVFTGGRGELVEAGEWLLVNDTYNANPAAVQAALDDLVDAAAARGRRPVAVLGDMLELGTEEERFHYECGVYAAEAGVRVLWAVGRLSCATAAGFADAAGEGQTVGHVESVHDVTEVRAGLRSGDMILFKASRSVGLEAMVSALERMAAQDVAGPTSTGRGDVR